MKARMKARSRMAVASLTTLAALAVACSDAHDPIAPISRHAGPTPGQASQVVRASSPNIYWLSFEVHSGSLPGVLLYDIPLTNGATDASLTLPTGEGYDVVVRAYDRYGTLTHEGKMGLASVALGTNTSVGLALNPVVDGVEVAKVSVGIVGQSRAPGGTRVVIKAPDGLRQGESARLVATVLNESGEVIDVRPGDLQWSVSDPGGAFIHPDPASPRTAIVIANLPKNLTVNVVYHQLPSQVSLGTIQFNPVVKLAAGYDFTCALRKYGTVSCWGDNREQMLGTANAPNTCQSGGSSYNCATTPQQVAPGRIFTDIAAGAYHACAIESGTGDTYCWGSNSEGEMGIGATGGLYAPTIVGGGHKFSQITAGLAHVCGIENGIAYCWGDNMYGEIGNGYGGFYVPGSSVTSPTPVVPAPYAAPYSGWTQLSAGQDFTCGIINSAAKCWGADSYVVGADWQGSGPFVTPRDVKTTYAPSIPARLGSASVARTMCTIMQGNGAWCWGYNVGSDPTNPNAGGSYYYPISITGGQNFTQIANGASQSCGIDTSYKVSCWGSNLYGASGQPGTSGYTVNPAPLNTTLTFSRIVTGHNHVCAEALTGTIYCWGLNDLGQLGDNALSSIGTIVPTPVWGT